MNWTNILTRIRSERGREARSKRRARLRIDALEARVVPGAMALDMDTANSPTATGYTRERLVKYTTTNHAGWQSTTGMGAVLRTTGSALVRDFHYGRDGTFLADVPNGTYDVVIGLGDPAVKRDFMSVWAEGTRLAADVTTQKNQFLEVRGRVTVTDGLLTIRVADAGGSNAVFAVTHMRFTPVDPAAHSLWPDTTRPTLASAADRRAVELGVRFQSDVAGSITGIRFYKGSANTGTHVGHLWGPGGTLLATATFTNEMATGWQQVLFDTPVPIQANQTYTASYLAPNGGYAFDSNYFTLSGVASGSLKVLPTYLGGGGTFQYGGGFPAQTYQDGNYWVDVVVETGVAPLTANAGPDQTANEAASVSFAGSAGGGAGTLSYHWDFGDGSTADGTLTPSHTYADNGTYTATLTVTDANNLVTSDAAVVTVNNVAPTASLTNNGPVNTNASVTVSFSGQADVSAPDQAAGFRYSYDFDNNGTWEQTDVTTASATTSFATSGSKVVKARIKDKDGGFTDYTTTITVNGPVTADAGADKTANEGSSVSFTGTAGGVGALSYDWDFGDGSAHVTGTLTPTHTYADNGTYTVTLTVTDAASQVATDTAVVTVNNVAPTASLTNNGPVNTNANVTISFSGQADVSAPDQAAGFRYSYDFDNNGTWEQTDVTSASATTSYATSGSKTVKARIKDKDGGFTDYTTTVTVNGAPTANAGVDKTANEGSSVSFTGTAGGGVGTLSYDWDFGDGSAHATGTLTPSHTYADNGTYTVTLTVTDAASQVATDTAVVTINNVAPTATLSNNGPVLVNNTVTVSFSGQADVSAPDQAAGFRYSYDFDNNGTWDLADVTTASASTSFATSGSKTVKARIKDKDGGFTDYTTTVTVNGALTANAGVDKTANEAASVSFTGAASGGIGTLSYDWDFGDGSAHSTGTLTPTHNYADNGTYTVTLTVTAGAVTATDTAVVTVNNVAPTASLTNNGPVNTNANVTISFSGQADVSAPDQAAGFRYSYDFDNNGTWEQTDVTTASATTSYATSGSKVVKARIKDKDGGFTDYTTTVTVNSPATGLVAAFSFDEGSGTTTGSSVGGLTGSISGATWVSGEQTGNALSFDGVNDRVTVPDANALDLTTGMTLEAWVRPAAVGNWATVILKERTGGLAYSLYGSDATGKPATYINTGGSDVSATGPTNLATGTWTHLAVTYDGSNLKLYTNAGLVRTTAHAGSMLTSTGTLSIGGNSIWGEYFSGLIDDVRVYNRALSAAEILADMNLPPTVTAVVPADGTTGVLTTADVTVTFSEPMDAATINATGVQLRTAAGATVAATVTYDAANRTATLNPTAALAAGATYRVVVTGGTGADAVKDSSGKPMAADFTSTFTTTDGSLPTANAGPDKTANEGASVSFTGSSTGGTGPKTYSWDFGDGTAPVTGTLTPSHTYADNGTYTVTLTVTDQTSATGTDSAVVTVNNVAPTAALANGGPVIVNTSVAITFSNQNDASAADQAAGFTYSFDFDNNGTWEVTDSTTASAVTSYPTAGNKTVKARIKDKDGGFTDYTTVVTVNSSTQGPTFYVSPSGSDTNNGSSGSPWKTLQHAADMVQAGDTVIVRSGNYAGFILGWNTPTAGTATQRITFQADPNASPGTVIINGRNSKTHVGIDLEPGCDYITLSGFTIDGAGGIANYPDKGSGIKVTGNNDWVIGNTVINIDYGFGITSNYANNVRIEGNTVTGTGAHGNANYGHAIYVAGDCTGARVVGNVLHNNDYIGLHINGDLGLIASALIAGNKIYNNGQNGINADGLQSSTIQNNLIYGYEGYGIVFYQIDASGPSKNNTIVNNTIVSTVAGAKAAIRIKDGGTGNVIRNNILLGGGGVSLRISDNSLPGLVSDYNVVGTLFQSEDTGATQSLASWRTQTGQDAHSLPGTAALLFVNATLNDYHLAVGSLAIDTGTSTGAPATDLDGQARPHGTGVDIGAYEYLG
jgi:PKD repeat protein